MRALLRRFFFFEVGRNRGLGLKFFFFFQCFLSHCLSGGLLLGRFLGLMFGFIFGAVTGVFFVVNLGLFGFGFLAQGFLFLFPLALFF